MNEDNARFCAECGQRFVKATNSNVEAIQPANLTNSNQIKTNILWNDEEIENDDDSKVSKTEFSNRPTLKSSNSAQNSLGSSNPNNQSTTNKENMTDFNNSNSDNPKSSKIRLHSPLLGSAVDNDESNEDQTMYPVNNSKNRGKGKLHSPLLGGSEDDDDYNDGDYKGSKPNINGKGKLHSPLLGGSGDDDFDNYGDRNFKGNKPSTSGKSKLHSPLLGGSGDDDFDNYSDRNSKGNKPGTSGKGKLHSPLLGGSDDDDFDDYNDRNFKGNKPGGIGKGKLHSPLLGGADDDFDNYDNRNFKGNKPGGSGKGKLHSPLLGGADDDYFGNYDDRNFKGNKSGGSGKGKLHSPLLGDSLDNFDDDDNYSYEEINDPNVLRSPLLLSKVHTNEPKQTNSKLNNINPAKISDIQNDDTGVDLKSNRPLESIDSVDESPNIISKSRTNYDEIDMPGLSQSKPNTKLIKPDNPKPISSNLSPKLTRQNLSQITNEVEAEIDNSKNRSPVKAKNMVKETGSFPNSLSGARVKINPAAIVMISIALFVKIGYIVLIFTQKPQAINLTFFVNEISQILLFVGCLIAVNSIKN